ncbi:MAG: peptide chain release factor N(5)-glutamine methyltransferase [Pseudomonadota bacterium]|nr:peptide chain release factor N(5)-glutamine methyltransferase [Pseudomonadota bacterium]
MTVTIKQALDVAAGELSQSDSPRLDAELLLAHILSVERSHLYAHPEQTLSCVVCQRFDVLVRRRAQSEPIAYLLGEKSFWDLTLKVSPAVLIPRPETELLVETALGLGVCTASLQVADLGTGSGAIALAVGKSRPRWRITGTDISPYALEIARQNRETLGLGNVAFKEGSWCDVLPGGTMDIIIANPPYIAPDDPHLTLGELRYEPVMALRADSDGYRDLQCIAAQAREKLASGGWLLMEHGYAQQETLQALLRDFGYSDVKGKKDLAGVPRMVQAHWLGPVSD